MAAKLKLVTPVFRVSFPHVFEAYAMEEGKAKKFSVSAIFDVNKFSPADRKRYDAILAELDVHSKDKFKKAWKDLPANIKRGLRSCDEKSELDGYKVEGGMFAGLTSKMRPGLIYAETREEITDKDDFYPGCYARATVSIYAYDQGGGKGVAIGLQNLMKVKDGDRLDSRTDAADDFGGVDDRDEEDPLG